MEIISSLFPIAKTIFESLTKLRRSKLFLVVFVLIALFFVFHRMFTQWGEVLTYRWKFKGLYLSACFIMFLLTPVVKAAAWKSILKLFGEKISVIRCFCIDGLSQLARYLPGKGVGYIVLVEMFKDAGIPRKSGVIAAAIDTSFYLISSMIVFLLSVRFLGTSEFVDRLKGFWILVPVGFIIVHPRLLFPLVNFGLKLTGREILRVSYRYHSALIVLFLFVVLRFGEGFGLWLLLRSFYENDISIIAMTGIFSISFAVGLLAILAPGGLVVREGVMISLLKLHMPFEAAIAFSVLSRVVLTLIEFLIGLIAWKMIRSEKRQT